MGNFIRGELNSLCSVRSVAKFIRKNMNDQVDEIEQKEKITDHP